MNKAQSLPFEHGPWTQVDVHGLLGYDLFSCVMVKLGLVL